MAEREHRHVFTSESVSEGHPDKVADQISDAVLDACLRQDPNAHVACETMVGPDIVVNMGEITARGFEKVDTRAVAAKVGVNRKSRQKQGAGDQGMMFGYATDETPSFMPAPVMYSHELLKMFARLRRRGGRYSWLRPDAKCQLSVVYEAGRPLYVDTVVLSHQTTEQGATEDNYREIRRLAADYLSKTGLLEERTKFYVNPTGKFVVGGPCGDCGLTGRKIIVDTYGGMAAHGGGAFSGKDPSKVDRSAAYYARYAAKNIVAAGLCSRCQVQVAYAIGVDMPVSFCVKTFGTAADGVTDERLEKMLAGGKVFDFRPYALIDDLGLLRPRGWSYEDTAAYGHFGRATFPWERLDRVEKIRKHLKKIA